jgi:hypothetical protein
MIRETIVSAVLLATFIYACVRPPSAVDVAAEGAYGAMLLDCIERANSLAESKACRAEVDRQWGVVQVATDGGTR